MSSAYYPMGMRQNNYPNGYVSWKSTNNHTIVPRNIKPFTNKDPENTYYGVVRRPRPIKHYRKGILINDTNINRVSKSSNGMPRLLEIVQDTPGSKNIFYKTSLNNNEICNGIPIIDVNNKLYNSTDTPTYTTTTDQLCCNKEKDALRNVIGPNTAYTSPRYYTSFSQYIHSRGNTYEQNIFDFEKIANPILNTYVINNVLNKNPNCPKESVYKPNNAQFANQGAVSNGTRILKLSTTTLERSKLISNNKVTINLSTCKSCKII